MVTGGTVPAGVRLGLMLKLIDTLSERLCDAYTARLREGLRRQRPLRRQREAERRESALASR